MGPLDIIRSQLVLVSCRYCTSGCIMGRGVRYNGRTKVEDFCAGRSRNLNRLQYVAPRKDSMISVGRDIECSYRDPCSVGCALGQQRAAATVSWTAFGPSRATCKARIGSKCKYISHLEFLGNPGLSPDERSAGAFPLAVVGREG